MESDINPQIRKVEIGVRKLEEVTVYPLSIADQIQFSDLITETIQKFFGNDESNKKSKDDKQDIPEVNGQDSKVKHINIDQMPDMEFVSFIIDLVQENLARILTLITDYNTEPKALKLFSKMTNNQAADLTELIYEMNYEHSSKKLIGLFKRATGILNPVQQVQIPEESLKRPSQPSLNDTHNTDSTTSLSSVSEKED